MTNRIKLGPLAVFLAIITIILSVLALLGYVTSQADVKLAERYGEVTTIKYSLESRGSEFLKNADDSLKEGREITEIGEVETRSDGVFTHTEEEGEYILTIDFGVEDNAVHVIRWRISKEWEEQNIFEDILH